MEKVNVTVRLEKDAVEFLDTLGKSLDRDRSYLIKCEPTAHRSGFPDSASFRFGRLGPTAHRSVPSLDRYLL